LPPHSNVASTRSERAFFFDAVLAELENAIDRAGGFVDSLNFSGGSKIMAIIGQPRHIGRTKLNALEAMLIGGLRDNR
jgi:hypothetical protein